MQFSSYFRLTSYATIAASVLALYVAGGSAIWTTSIVAGVLAVAFKLEGTRWQLSERMALAVILCSLPVFYVDWRILTPYLDIANLETGRHGSAEESVLSHMIVFLSAVKLLQRKGDRTIEILMQAVEIPGFVMEKQWSWPGLSLLPA